MLRSVQTKLLSLAIIGVLAGTAVVDAVHAQDSRSNQRQGKNSGKPEIQYPNATRVEPKAKPSDKMQSKLKKLFDTYSGNDYDKAKSLADEIIADPKASDFDKAQSSYIASYASYNLNDNDGAKKYVQQAVDLNLLDNNSQFGALLMLAQLQAQDQQYAQAEATLDKFFDESKSQKPEDLAVRGSILYEDNKAKDAIPYLKQAVDATPDPKDQWLQMLMASYADAGQSADAIALAEKLAAKAPNDKKAQMNLAAIYQQSEKDDKAVAVLEKIRANGQFTEERDYKQLYTTYANMDGKEKQVIDVVNEGLSKGILKPDYTSYVALAQAYYYSTPVQIDKAIDAWKRGAPLAPTGETWLNLARVLQNEGRIGEAKDAAKAAKAKGGLKKPADADKIINLPAKK